MEYDPQDQDIVRLLTNLKNVQGEYPENMLMARRQSYLKQMVEIGAGVGAGQGIQNIAKSPKLPRTAPSASTLLESALIIAVVTEASLMAYFYREQLTDFFQDLTTSAEEVTPAPAISTDLDGQQISPSPAVTSTLPATTIPTGITEAATGTSIPDALNENGRTLEAHSTPTPNGNNGNHYGQTPKPERTKDNNGNKENNGNSGNNDKPPKKKTPKK